ncbi:hypothetical protein HG536_0F04520 [Torulaspora globosa]|uniref:Mto1-like Mto2p-binding domain-containing protein n=1 Tax=Torulaspora globosa TaxID=48254 RepID=A0A7G3ZKU0_9SACH|nr:uncharacterized protein HG536_0F04520 [Torulaspora globosa]QLL34126.1 hypothetical protein HG536_0F04520 [Torulaspora globosa]
MVEGLVRDDGLALSPRVTVNGDSLSFTSAPCVAEGTSPAGTTGGITARRPFLGSPGDVDTTDEEDMAYDSSGLAIPRLRESMTPWRSVEGKARKEGKRRASRSATLVDGASPSNSRPDTRNSLFSLDGAYTVATSTTCNDVEQLQKQLTTYKLKVRALLEVIKQLNYGDDEQRNRDSFYGKLLSTLSQSEELEELRRKLSTLENSDSKKQTRIEELEKDIFELSDKLAATKNEHAETLEYANEYLEHSELLAKKIDEMLNLLLENVEFSAEERDALQKTIQISSSFAMVKMNALVTTFGRVLQDMKSSASQAEIEENHGQTSVAAVDAIANSTEANDTNESVMAEKTFEFPVNESAMDTRLEIAIEGLHQEYDKFFHGIRSKIERSADLEKLLLSRLSQQDRLLNRLAGMSESKALEQSLERHKESVQTIDGKESTSRANLDLSKSYKDHIDNLNSLVQAMNSAMSEKNEELQQVKDQLKDQDVMRKNEQRLRTELQEYKKLSKLKENNWESFASDLEKSLGILQMEKDQMLEVMEQLRSDLQIKESKVEELLMDAQRTNQTVRNMTNLHDQDKMELNEKLKDKIRQVKDLQNECTSLRAMLTERTNSFSLEEKYQNEFERFKDHLLLHLEKVFTTLGKILQQKSIDQSKRKLEIVRRMHGPTAVRSMQPKLESLYNFIETAQESIVESYTSMVLLEKERKSESHSSKELQLRIEELGRKWISERERRKLDITAAESRISRLEAENDLLREQLYSSTIRK